MTRNQIIEDLFTGKNFNDCLSKMNPSCLRDDLKQEVALIVCELPEDKLVQLKQQNHLEFYVVKIILNLVKNKYSPFARKFRTVFQELSQHEKAIEDEDPQARADRERAEDMVLDEILTISGDHPDWYHNTLLRLYIEVGNYRAIERATRIPYASCYKSIQKYMNQLKGKVRAYVLASDLTGDRNARLNKIYQNPELCQKK